MVNWPLLIVQKKYFFLLAFFGRVLTILAWTKCRLVTKYVLFSTHFHSCFFLTFPLKYYLYKKTKVTKIICYLFIRVWYNFEGTFFIVSDGTKFARLAPVWECPVINTPPPHQFSGVHPKSQFSTEPAVLSTTGAQLIKQLISVLNCD